MTDLPQAAIDAADAATEGCHHALAVTALKAAAPHIAAAERERIRQLAVAVDATYDAACPDGAHDCTHQDTPFASLLTDG